MRRSLPIILVLVALFAIAKWTVFKEPDPTFIPTPEQLAFQCMKCEHAWQVPTADAAAWYKGGMANDYTRIPCPECESKNALLERRCPYCRKGYVPTRKVLEANMDKDRNNDLAEICSHCEKNVLAFPPP